MKKTVEIDLSSDRLIAVAADLVESHNYIQALKMLNKNAELNCNDEDSYMLYAEIYDDLELYEKCVNSWFKYLDSAQCGDFSEAYEGLALAYLNLGNETVAASYYKKLLSDMDRLDDEMREEILSAFLRKQPNPLKFVYPPQIADYSDEISQGIEAMKSGEYEKAEESFSRVPEENEAYYTARNYIAMCRIIGDRCEQAEAECLAILEKRPQDIQALTTLAAVKTEQKKSEEGVALAKRLLSLDVTASEDIYKIATVCCENKMHEEAFSLFSKLEAELPYDSSVLFFKAVSAFNSGNFEECFSAFDKLIAVYPDAVCAQYWYKVARQRAEEGDKTELSYFYRLPAEQREEAFKLLAVVTRLPKNQTKKLFDIVDISDCIRWCFDEIDPRSDSEIHFAAAACAVKAKLDAIVCDVLLNAFVNDAVKMYILTLLGERNEDNNFGVVISHLYKSVDFHSLKLGRVKRKRFVAAYARLVGHFSVIDNSYGEKFASACETLYEKMEAEQRLDKAVNEDALSAAVFKLAAIPEIAAQGEISRMFDVPDEKINEIIGEI